MASVVKLAQDSERCRYMEKELGFVSYSSSRQRCLDLYSDLAIEDYNNRHENDRFKVHQPLCFISFYNEQHNTLKLHLNVIGENLQTSKLKLFFATILREEVLTCTIVEPGNPLFQVGCFVCKPNGTIYHPCLASSEYQGYHTNLGPYEKAAKVLFEYAYKIESSVQVLDTEEADKLKKTFEGYARSALVAHQYIEDVKYEYLESVYGVRFHHDIKSNLGTLWAHLIFKAKNVDPGCTDDSPVYFFAELCLESDWDPVNCVFIIQCPNSVSPGDGKSCKCPIDHPEFVAADCEKGKFADSLCNGQYKGLRSELVKKNDVASMYARGHYDDVMRSQPIIYE